jgi:ribosomal protein S18 acetylase RimI-like enzyme
MEKIRIGVEADIPGMAALRVGEWGTQEYWEKRITAYLRRELHPQQALDSRIIYVATKEDTVVGFIAGHLTRRFGCDGELEWINVGPEYRSQGIASALLRQLATWFASQQALYICVNCAADNLIAQKFYKKHGAEKLSEHWLIWKDISL